MDIFSVFTMVGGFVNSGIAAVQCVCNVPRQFCEKFRKYKDRYALSKRVKGTPKVDMHTRMQPAEIRQSFS